MNLQDTPCYKHFWKQFNETGEECTAAINAGDYYKVHAEMQETVTILMAELIGDVMETRPTERFQIVNTCVAMLMMAIIQDLQGFYAKKP